jgi:hypothetical protein
MKRNILFLLILLIRPILFSQSVFTLDGASGTRVYTNIDSALKYAVDGDYLYLPASTIYKPDGTMIKKRLNIFGAGHYPDSTKATGITSINGNVHFWTESTGSSLQGVYITGNIYWGTDGSNGGSKNVLIQRCNVANIYLSENGSTFRGAENIIITQNIIREGIFFAGVKNVVFENNIIEGTFHFATGQVFIRNNILLRRLNTAFYGMIGARIENNIFLSSASFYGSNSDGLSFYNNIFREGDPIGGFPGSGNKFNVSNLFINQSGTSFSYEQNYKLNADSPAKNAGMDGKDCGIYGGANPYKEGAVPANPHIRTKVVPAQTDAQGKLNIQITVAAQNN